MRSIFAYVFAALIAALLWVAITPSDSFAATASWDGEQPVYQGKKYSGPGTEQLAKDTGFPSDTIIYSYLDSNSDPKKIHLLYFAPGTDPATADSANYATFDMSSSGTYSNRSTPIAIEFDKNATETANEESEQETSSCQIDSGIGWIVCPVTNFFAKGMDWMFNILVDFMEVRSPEIRQDSAMYRVWKNMRDFANVAFVIAFLIIIYSQLTNFGISNYSLKKLLPRVIIAALLVNMSFIICALAIDISNALGHGLQGLFISMRDTIIGSEGNSWEAYSWESVASFVLAGGVAAGAAGVAAFSAVTTFGTGTIFLLLPVLLGVGLSLLVALLIIAARQALITVLTIISPLAFVAFLLPNTESWFSKWRGLFMTMLIFFPAFSLVFGGSQLAGTIIIQNATSINVIVLGLAVQVAPLILTPLLLRLSGTLISRIAGIVNNPNKGMIDRTRNFAKDRAENVKARRLGTPARKGLVGITQRAGQRSDHARRRREAWRGAHNAAGDASWAQSAAFRASDQAMREASGEKNIGESSSEAVYLASGTHERQAHRLHDIDTDKKLSEQAVERSINLHVRTDDKALEKEMRLRYTTDTVSLEKAKLDKIHEELRAGATPVGAGAVLSAIADRQGEVTRNLAIASIASQTAKKVQNEKLSTDILQNTDQIDGQLLRDYAKSIDPEGDKSAVAFAANQKHDADVKLVNEREQIIRQFQLNGAERQKLATGESSVTKKQTDANGRSYQFTFDKNDEFMQEAAMDMQMSGQGSIGEILAIIANSGGTLKGFKKEIAAAIPKNGIPSKAAFTGGQFIDQVLQGKIKTEEDLQNSIIDLYIQKGKFKNEQLAQNDAASIAMMVKAVENATPMQRREHSANFAELDKSIVKILTEDRLVNHTSKASRDEFNKLRTALQKPVTP